MLDTTHHPDLSNRHEAPVWLSKALSCIDALYNLAVYLTISPAAAEDLVLETYASALQEGELLAAAPSIRLGLYRILWQTAQQRALLRHSLPPPEPSQALPGELDRVRESCSGETLQVAFRCLPEHWRMLLLLDLEGLSEAELAYALGCAAVSVRPRLSRAHAVIWRKLSDTSDPILVRDPTRTWRA